MTDLNEKAKISTNQEQELRQITKMYNEANEIAKRREEEIYYVRDDYNQTIHHLELEISNLRATIDSM